MVIVRRLGELVWVGKGEILHGDESFSSGVPSRTAGNALLAIGGQVERNKQEQV